MKNYHVTERKRTIIITEIIFKWQRKNHKIDFILKFHNDPKKIQEKKKVVCEKYPSGNFI